MNKQDWEVKQFNEVFDLQMGRTPSRDNPLYWENGLHKWISISDLGNEKYIFTTKELISDLGKIESKIKVVPKNTVIMSFKLSIGKVAITSEDMYTNEAIMAFHLRNPDRLETEYIYYYLKSYNWGGTNRAVMGATLNKASISLSQIIIPPLPIQKQIVKELDALNEIIVNKKKQLAELNVLAHATFLGMFGDPLRNEKGWAPQKIENICSSIIRGPFGSALKKEFFVQKSNLTYKIYEQKHAIKKNAFIGDYYIDEKLYKTLERFAIFPKDIIMSCSGTIGEFFEIPDNAERGIINQALLKFTILNL